MVSHVLVRLIKANDVIVTSLNKGPCERTGKYVSSILLGKTC